MQKDTMRPYIYLSIAFILQWQSSLSQNWTPAFSSVNPMGNVLMLLPDPVNNQVIVGGCFDTLNGIPVHHIAALQANTVVPYGAGINMGSYNGVFCSIVFNGDLFIGGKFTSAGDSAANNVARWDGSSWHPVGLGLPGYVHKLCEYNGELYAAGSFSSLGSTLAKWTGFFWAPVGNIPDAGDLCVYNYELYIGGNTLRKLSNHVVYTLPVNGVESMKVFNNELYASGSFISSSLSDIRYIKKFNGFTWTQIGNAFKTNSTYPAMISDMEMYNGNLYAGGGFDSVGTTPIRNLALWNGMDWENVGSGTDGWVFRFAVLGDKLYAGGNFDTINGIAAQRLAIYSEATAISETAQQPSVNIYPNPFTSSTTIEVPANGNFDFVLYDQTGRITRSVKVNGPRFELHRGNLSPGIYFYHLRNESQITSGKLIIE
jgi:hypothetical protein